MGIQGLVRSRYRCFGNTSGWVSVVVLERSVNALAHWAFEGAEGIVLF